jgi:membrane protease YdiL (CAAX protease family)
MPGALDHLIAFLFIIAGPCYDYSRSFPRFRQAVARGEPTVRLRFYRSAIVGYWLAGAAVVGTWWWEGRSWNALGLGTGSGWRPWLGAALAVASVIALSAQARAAIAPAARAAMLAQLGPARPYLPHSSAELRRFYAVSVSAGICEEVLFRGFLVWYFAAWLPLAGAIPLAATCFAVPHLWAGRGGAVKAGVMALLFSALYLGLGSLWAAMAIHAAVDISSGWLAHRIITDENKAP